MDRLTSMAVFVKTAESGSFAAAALAFGISSQMAGKHVGMLEERVGARLLNRTTRRQSLTEIGQIFTNAVRPCSRMRKRRSRLRRNCRPRRAGACGSPRPSRSAPAASPR